MKHRKAMVIGTGHVGSHVAMALAFDHTADEVVLVDKDEKKAKAHALDIYDAMSFSSHSVLVRAGDYSDVEDSDVVVIAIGEPRKPGQDRVDMLDHSIIMCKELIASLKPYKIPGIVISITNPCDVIADYLRKGLGVDDCRMFGTGTLLDTARLVRVLSRQTGVSRDSIQGFVMGEHGESSMIPFSQIHIGALKYSDFDLSDEDVLTEMRRGGWVIVEGKNCTEFGIGRAAAYMAGVIMRDEKKILPASVNLHGEYGENDVQIGVPCVIGGEGIERVLEIPLTDEEKEQFHHSCDVVRGNIAIAAAK
jgi:L-lactate dehydrogenase